MAVPEGTTLVWLCGRWPRLVGGLCREVNYTVTQLMHSECGRICRGAVGEGGPYKRGTSVFSISKSGHFICFINFYAVVILMNFNRIPSQRTCSEWKLIRQLWSASPREDGVNLTLRDRVWRGANMTISVLPVRSREKLLVFESIAVRASLSSVGFVRTSGCSTKRPSSHSIAGNVTARGEVASRWRSYQNSPTAAL